jgi:ADP-ribosyl-[dinitrogen reductase] hydrolase
VLAQASYEFVREIQDAAELIKADLDAAQKDDPLLYGPELHLHAQDTFVRVTLRVAFWELFHAPSFEAGLLDVVNRGGDTCGNGAVTGALLGAFHGARSIPERWHKPMLAALGEGRGGPLWERYHPRHLLLVLDK